MGLIIPFETTLRPSRSLLAAQAAMHAASFAAVVAVTMDGRLQALLGALVVGSLCLTLHRHRQPRWAALSVGADGLRLKNADGAWLRAEVLDDSTVHPWLTVLRLKTGDAPCALPLLADSLPEEAFRRLRVWLRWNRSRGGDAATML